MNGLDPIPHGEEPIASVPHHFCNINNEQLSNLDLIEINLTQPLNIQGQPENHFLILLNLGKNWNI